MTTTMPPHTPGLRRVIPLLPRPEMGDHLRTLVMQREGWVRRPAWARYLDTGDPKLLEPIDGLTRDQFVAIHAWFRQQRHALHRVLEGGVVAPDGWVESLPLYDVMREGARLEA